MEKVTEDDQLLWSEVEMLLGDNNVYTLDDVQNVYAIMGSLDSYSFKMFEKENNTWEFRMVCNSPPDSLWRRMYKPGYCPVYYGTNCVNGLEILYDTWLVIQLKNAPTIIGRYGYTDFGYECEQCHYCDDDDLLEQHCNLNSIDI